MGNGAISQKAKAESVQVEAVVSTPPACRFGAACYNHDPDHISLDLNVRGCVKFDSILMRNVTKIGVSSSFGVLGSIKQKLIFLTQNQLHKVIFLESDKT